MNSSLGFGVRRFSALVSWRSGKGAGRVDDGESGRILCGMNSIVDAIIQDGCSVKERQDAPKSFGDEGHHRAGLGTVCLFGREIADPYLRDGGVPREAREI